jgi:hypothetical protein
MHVINASIGTQKALILISSFDLIIRAQQSFTTVPQQLNQGEGKKRAVYRFFLDFLWLLSFIKCMAKEISKPAKVT